IVLEIGPGLGSLTRMLVYAAKKVVAIEKDDVLAANLADLVKAENLQVVNGDILQFDFISLPEDYKLVANIPYYLTSHLIRVLSETSNPPKIASLLVQKEVAERLTAKPGNMSILAVTAQFYWQVSLGMIVKAHLFEPPPKVDSQIVKLVRRSQPIEVEGKQFFRLVRAGFSGKRKTLVNNLSASYHIDKNQVAKAIESAGLNPGVRAQTLSLDDWSRLSRLIN
ncbi:MAG: 16S rRNA (adenine(1518)-N(6)/adenine(1519)-N(6))-dimethyltransferase RsmA, partial [Candidatus Saccharimonadales bacterium]